MSSEQQITLEDQTSAFFDRPASEVVRELSETVYIYGKNKRDFPTGQAKTILLETPTGEKSFKITLAELYTEEDLEALLLMERLQKLRSMQRGGIIAFPYRVGTLSFIKTRGGENILIRELEDIQTGKKTKNPTEVTRILGLASRQEGKLTYLGGDKLKFEKVA